MADLALSNVSNRNVESLTQSEYRRVAIGVQLVRDPVVLLLDEPTADLDPLNTYFVISILANHAKKYNRIVLLTMEKPRLGENITWKSLMALTNLSFVGRTSSPSSTASPTSAWGTSSTPAPRG